MDEADDRASFDGFGDALDGYYDAADLRDLGPGFGRRATDHDRRFDPSLTAVGVCGDADVERALAALSARGVDVAVSREE